LKETKFLVASFLFNANQIEQEKEVTGKKDLETYIFNQ